MNFQYEFLQEIVVRTAQGRILRLHLSELSQQFRLQGQFYESTSKDWWLVDFPMQRTGNCNKLLEDCFNNFGGFLTKSGDSITAVENPCNAPFISGAQQQAMLQQLGIAATVSVN